MHEPESLGRIPSNFSKDVLTLVTGTTIAQIITILASPIITRLYGPETFGLLALFTSITGIIGVIACMRYELAIMLPETDEEAANVFGLSVIFVMIVSILSIFPLILFQQPLLEFLKAPQLAPFIWLIPLTVMASGTSLALNYWNTRAKHFHRLSITRMINSGSNTGTQLGMGFLGNTSGGTLIGANVLGQIISMFVLAIVTLREHLFFFKNNITRKGLIEVLFRYNIFLKYDIWSALLNTISWQIPVFVLSYFFTTAIVGYYSLGMMVIQLPMSLIGGAISQVFFQRAAEAKVTGTLRQLVEIIFEVLVKIGMFPIFILAFIGKDLFIVIFGSSWGDAGMYVQILSIWAFFWFLSSPLSTLLTLFKELKLSVKMNIAILLTRLFSLILGGVMGSPFLAVCLFSITGVFLYGYACFIFLNFADISLIKILKILVSNFLTFLPAGIFIWISTLFLQPLHVVIFSTLILFLYYVYLLQTNHQIREIINGWG